VRSLLKWKTCCQPVANHDEAHRKAIIDLMQSSQTNRREGKAQLERLSIHHVFPNAIRIYSSLSKLDGQELRCSTTAAIPLESPRNNSTRESSPCNIKSTESNSSMSNSLPTTPSGSRKIAIPDAFSGNRKVLSTLVCGFPKLGNIHPALHIIPCHI
jgi:hypothetical protein